MSINASLANPGASLVLDGQQLQEQQDAEVEREECLQLNELQQVLLNAFDDLDDDILSDSSSDGVDSINTSHLSRVSGQLDIRHPHTDRSMSSCRTPLAPAALTQSRQWRRLPRADDSLDSEGVFVDWAVGAGRSDGGLPGSRGVSNVDRPQAEDELLPAIRSDRANAEGCPGDHPPESMLPHHDWMGDLRFCGGSGFAVDVNAIPTWESARHTQHYDSTGVAACGMFSYGGSDQLAGPFPPIRLCHDAISEAGSSVPCARTCESGPMPNAHGHRVHDELSPLTKVSSTVRWGTVGPPPDSDCRKAVAYVNGDAAFQMDSRGGRGRDVWGVAETVVGQLPDSTGTESECAGASVEDADYRVMYVRSEFRDTAAEPRPPLTERDANVGFTSPGAENFEETRAAQLQILYNARGREIENLKAVLDRMSSASEKELRRLKHLLLIATGEKESLESTVSHSRQQVAGLQTELTESRGHLDAADARVKTVVAAKEEAESRLSGAQLVVESLSRELAELRSCESLSNVRLQHECVVSGLSQRFEAELQELRQRLDGAGHAVLERDETLAKLHEELKMQIRSSDEARLSRSDVVNSLTRQLDESQKRCCALLAADRSQLQPIQDAKKQSNDLCESLKLEVVKLKEQLCEAEESVVMHAGPTSGHDPKHTVEDRATDLHLPNLLDTDFRNNGRRLKMELERCMSDMADKRVLVSELEQRSCVLQGEVDRLAFQLEESRSKAERLQEVQIRLEEVQTEKNGLSKVNGDLKKQLEEMVQQHDRDKQEAILRCRHACQDANELIKEKLECQLRSEYAAEQLKLIAAHKDQMSSLKCQLKECGTEVDKVKDLYVQSSRQLQQKEEEVGGVRRELEEAMDELKSQEERRTVECRRMVECERRDWERDVEQRVARDWEIRLSVEREKWSAVKEAEYTARQQFGVDSREGTPRESQAQLEQAERQFQQDGTGNFFAAQIGMERSAWEAEVMEALNAELISSRRLAHQEAESIAESDRGAERGQDECGGVSFVRKIIAGVVSASSRTRSEQQTDLGQPRLEAKIAAWKGGVKRVDAEMGRRRQELELMKACAESRREAVLAVRNECQADYDRLAAEAKSRLDLALETARLRQSEELADQERRHRGEISAHQTVEKNLRQAISRSIKHPPLVGVSCHFPYGSARSRGVSLSDTHTAQGVSGADGIAIISSPSIPAGGFCKLIPEHNIQAMHASAESPHVDKHGPSNAPPATCQQTPASKHLPVNKHMTSDICRLHSDHCLSSAPGDAPTRLPDVRWASSESSRRNIRVEGPVCSDGLLVSECDGTQQDEGPKVRHGGLDERLERMRRRAERAESALTAVNRQHRRDIEALHSSLESSDGLEAHRLAKRLSEVEKCVHDHKKQERVWEGEKETLISKIEYLNQQLGGDSVYDKITRTETSHSSAQTVGVVTPEKVKDQCMAAVRKLKDGVLEHIHCSNERSASAMRREIKLERQRTTRRLRTSCRQQLDGVLRRCPSESLSESIKRELDSVFHACESGIASDYVSGCSPRLGWHGNSKQPERDYNSSNSNGWPRSGGSKLGSASTVISEGFHSAHPLTPLPVDFSQLSADGQTSAGVYYSLRPDYDDTVSTVGSVAGNDVGPMFGDGAGVEGGTVRSGNAHVLYVLQRYGGVELTSPTLHKTVGSCCLPFAVSVGQAKERGGVRGCGKLYDGRADEKRK